MDIVERLKMRAEFFREHKISNPDADMDDEAADEIERLREALSFYAEWGVDAPATDAIIEHDRGDIARSALQQKRGE